MSQSLICSRKIHDYSSFKALVDRSITAVTSEMLEGTIGIGYAAFQYCSKLTSVEIPNSVGYFDTYAFQYCSKLTSINIPNGFRSFGFSSLSYCSSLGSIVIPNSVTSIGSSAFYECSRLTSFTIHATTPPTLGGNSVFNGTHSNLIIYVPSESVETYKSASGWSTYASKIQAISEA